MSHNHNHHTNENEQKSYIGLAFFLNLSFTIVELIGGILTNSVAILSDAVHDLGDSVSLSLSWYFQKLSKRGRSVRYTYGYKRFSLLGAIINSIILVLGSIYIIAEAIPRLFAPEPTSAQGMFLLAILGIVINGIAVLRTRKATSINERVVSLHLLEDVLGWVAVLVGAVVMHFTGWTIIDPILSLAVACFVLFNVYKNIRQVLPILLQGTPDNINQEKLVEELTKIKSIKEVHDLHIWSLDESYKILTAHIVLNESCSMSQLSDIKKEVYALLQSEGIQHITIEFEVLNEKCDCELS